MNDIYQAVTAKILEQLEKGVVPWRKTWITGIPKNLATNREYRGMNIILLGLSIHTSRYWATYSQAKKLGGHVKKGEKATPIYYWHWRTSEELAKLQKTHGSKNLAPCVCFTSYVFNLDQLEGVEAPIELAVQKSHEMFALAQWLVDHMPQSPAIRETGFSSPHYNWVEDRVTVPYRTQFENSPAYYATLFHELVHATGHPKRLGRLEVAEAQTIEKYSFEELVAEFGSAFLCARAGVKDAMTDDLAASYIDGWATVFRKDNRILMRAASAAQRASDYVAGRLETEEYRTLEESNRRAA